MGKNHMTIKLFIQAISKFLVGMVLVVLLIFLPAGTFDYFNGWLFIAILFIPMFSVGIVLMLKNPELLKRRLDAKEEQKEQDIIVKLIGLMFIACFIVAGCGVRFSWYVLPKVPVFIATIVFLVAYLLYMEVIRENAYLSRTIEVQEKQRVIDYGLYGVVRHLMYSATILLFLSIPLVLGSIFSFIIFLTYPFLIANRIKYEEQFLEKELEGYVDYKCKVKYRLIPFIW